MPYDERDRYIDVPTLVTLESCDFPLIEEEVAGYRVLRLPPDLRRLFEEGVDAVRINSSELAHLLPDFGGKTSGDYSLLPHQDHLDPCEDRRRYLVLSKPTESARGATSLLTTPATAKLCVPQEEACIKKPERRERIGAERQYDPRFSITEDQYHRCFDAADGYEHVVQETLRSLTNPSELAVRLGILGYLIRGEYADTVLRSLRAYVGKRFLAEPWERSGVLIFDNTRVFHAREGGSTPPLKRNFCV